MTVADAAIQAILGTTLVGGLAAGGGPVACRSSVALRHRGRIGVAAALLCGVVAAGAVHVTLVAQESPRVSTITGTVRMPDGTPAAGCEVRAVYQDMTSRDWHNADGRTGDDGSFGLALQDPIPAADVIARRDGYALAFAQAEPGGHVELQFAAKPQSITGTVRDPDGFPLEGAKVYVPEILVMRGADRVGSVHLGYDDPWVADTTDEEGRYELTGLPPDLPVELVAEAALFARWGYGPGDPDPLPGDEVNIKMRRAATLSGRVLRDGQPVPGVSVWANSEGLAYDAVRTDANGAYSLEDVRPGRIRLHVTAPEGSAAPWLPNTQVAAGTTRTDLDFYLTAGAVIEGDITLEGSGAPAAGARVTVRRPLLEGYVTESAAADGDGHYVLRVWPGEVRLNSYHADSFDVRGTPEDVALRVAEGDRKTGVDFVVKAPPVFAGVVVSEDEGPIPGAHLWIVGSMFLSRWPAPRVADDDGRFRIVPQTFEQQGPWAIFATDPDGTEAGVASRSALDDSMTIRVAPAGTIKFRVIDPAGDPVEGFPCLIELVGGTNGTTVCR